MWCKIVLSLMKLLYNKCVTKKAWHLEIYFRFLINFLKMNLFMIRRLCFTTFKHEWIYISHLNWLRNLVFKAEFMHRNLMSVTWLTQSGYDELRTWIYCSFDQHYKQKYVLMPICMKILEADTSSIVQTSHLGKKAFFYHINL